MVYGLWSGKVDIWTKVKHTLKQKHIPIEVILELTKRCNLKCCHCYNIKDSCQLSFKQVKIIFKQLRDAGTLFLVLTGGEVFLHPDIMEILNLAKNMNFNLKIFTNGTLITEEIARNLAKIMPSEIGISIQGARAKTHDLITGVKGSYEKSIQAIKILKAKSISVNLKTTLMQQNFSEFKEIIKLAADLGIVYIMDPVIAPRDDGSCDVLAYRLTDAQLEEFYQFEVELKGYIYEPEEKEYFCQAGFTFGSISANGDVYPCIQLPHKLGNIFEQDFSGIWQNAEFLKKMRRSNAYDNPECQSCKIADVCTRCPGLAFLEDGDAFGKSAVACMHAQVYKKLGDRVKGEG
ncbi:MAG: radical SAM protein [Candidatus Omnitrophota bacterium]